MRSIFHCDICPRLSLPPAALLVVGGRATSGIPGCALCLTTTQPQTGQSSPSLLVLDPFSADRRTNSHDFPAESKHSVLAELPHRPRLAPRPSRPLRRPQAVTTRRHRVAIHTAGRSSSIATASALCNRVWNFQPARRTHRRKAISRQLLLPSPPTLRVSRNSTICRRTKRERPKTVPIHTQKSQ
jgi:hypothetical protein